MQWKCWLLFRKRRKSDIVRIILVYTFFSHTRSSFLIFSGLKNFQPVSAIMLKPFSSISLPLPSLFASCSTVIMQCWGRKDSTHCQQTLLPCRHSLRPFSPCLNFVACWKDNERNSGGAACYEFLERAHALLHSFYRRSRYSSHASWNWWVSIFSPFLLPPLCLSICLCLSLSSLFLTCSQYSRAVRAELKRRFTWRNTIFRKIMRCKTSMGIALWLWLV